MTLRKPRLARLSDDHLEALYGETRALARQVQTIGLYALWHHLKSLEADLVVELTSRDELKRLNSACQLRLVD